LHTPVIKQRRRQQLKGSWREVLACIWRMRKASKANEAEQLLPPWLLHGMGREENEARSHTQAGLGAVTPEQHART